MKFAVIATGGKQYKVSEGASIKIEKMPGTHTVGDKLTFDQVLMTAQDDAVTVGTPIVKGGKVSATLTEISRAPKISVIKYKQKSKYFKKYGHRQPFFKVKIDSIA